MAGYANSVTGWDELMSTHFAEVLANESACLTGVADGAMLACWRHHIVEELMTPRSPYVLAMQQTDDVSERADFLDQWRELIAETVDRLLKFSTTVGAPWSSTLAPGADVDAQRTAVLILAALHGGSTLSQLVQDPRPHNAALDLALAPLAASEDNWRAMTATEEPTQ